MGHLGGAESLAPRIRFGNYSLMRIPSHACVCESSAVAISESEIHWPFSCMGCPPAAIIKCRRRQRKWIREEREEGEGGGGGGG